MAAAECPFDIINNRDNIEIIDTRGTIDVFHTAPFGIVDVLDAFDLRNRTNLWALLGATVPASPPDIFALPFSGLTVLLQLRARSPPQSRGPACCASCSAAAPTLP